MNTPRLTLTLVALLASGCASSERYGSPEEPSPRSFHVRYVTQLEGLPVGETLRLWIPAPRSDTSQAISNMTVTPLWGAAHAEAVEPGWGNRIIYMEVVVKEPAATVTVEYDVSRSVVVGPHGAERLDSPERYLRGSRLQVVSDDLRAAHENITPPEATPLQAARAYYDHVLAEMTYDKSGEGWGRGDSQYACEVGKGNCTDFHSFFQALCMAEGIPSRFSIGIFGDYERRAEEYPTGGYHCWAEFHVDGQGWMPVDISEADKDPSKREVFFGAHSDNRVTLSSGRDLVLEPPQAGAPLNYFVNPYAEVAGAPFLGVSKTAHWRDH